MYAIEYSKSSQKTLRHLPRNLADKLLDKMEDIAKDPYAQHRNVKPLTGTPYYRLRVGDWRVIYELQDKRLIILVLKIASRGEVYR